VHRPRTWGAARNAFTDPARVHAAFRDRAGTIFEKFGFTVDRVVGVTKGVLDGSVRGPQPTLEPGHLPAPRGGHPSLDHGDPGVDRTPSTDPGHS